MGTKVDLRVSGRCCIVESCKLSRRKSANIRLFKFPTKNTSLLKEWMKACCVSEEDLFQKKILLVCQRHFNPEQIGRTLKRNAIPERYLDTPSTEIIKIENDEINVGLTENSKLKLLSNSAKSKTRNNKIFKNDKKDYRKSGRRCIIKSCRAAYRSSVKLRFFSFPNSKTERFKKWIKLCKLTQDDLKIKNIIICEKHFWKAQLCGKRYTTEAEPKFFLSGPRYKVIGPSDPNFKIKGEFKVENTVSNKSYTFSEKSKKLLNKCIIKTCGIISKDFADMMIFPKDTLNLFDIWSDIFKLDPSEIFNIDIDSIKNNDILYICQKHSLATKELSESNNEEKLLKENSCLDKIKNTDTNDRLKLLRAVEIYKEVKVKDHERKNFEFYRNLETYYEEEVVKIKKEAEIERIKYLSIISLLKEENYKLKEEINKLK